MNIKLENVIQDMLFKYECVVVPYFGGFVSHYQAAQILKDKNLIIPPSKSLTFNFLLKKNDGLLAQELVNGFDLSYKEAIHIISLQVDSWLTSLSKGGRVSISGVGKFTKNKRGIILFTQDLKTNLLNDAYGLNVIKAQELKKEGITGKIKEEYIQRQSSPSFNHRVKKIATGGSVAAMLLVLTIWSYLNFDMVQHQTQSLGVFVSEEEIGVSDNTQEHNNKIESAVEKPGQTNSDNSLSNELPNDTLKTHIEPVNEFNLPVSGEQIEDINHGLETDIIAVNKDVAEEKNQETKIDNTEVHTDANESSNDEFHKGKYIVVAGCFRSAHNATNFVNKLKSLGYDAHLSGYSAKGLHRVAYGVYDNKSDALKSMRWIQSTHNTQAWMTNH